MAVIKETRKLIIKERIITLDNLRSLSNVLHQEFSSLNSVKTHTKISFSATCADASSFQSEDTDLFNADSILSKKKVESVSLTLTHYETNAFVEIELSHGDSSWRNQVTIHGEDSKWVNGTLKIIEETIESFAPQNVFLFKNKQLIKTVFALGLGSLYFYITTLIPSEPSTDTPEWVIQLSTLIASVPLGDYLFKYFIFYVIGFFPAEFLFEKLKSLWPSVELQIGPEHTHIEKRRRIWVANAFILGVLPIIHSLISDILSAL
jgi:hypothetical protein